MDPDQLRALAAKYDFTTVPNLMHNALVDAAYEIECLQATNATIDGLAQRIADLEVENAALRADIERRGG